MNSTYGRVVAGVAPADHRFPMILWAAGEAAARDAELYLVTAVPPYAPPEEYLPADAAENLRDAGRAHLVEAAQKARAVHPGLFVMTDVVGGVPAEVLRRAGAEADLLVVGADEQGPFAETITGSVPGALLTSSSCPLGVVPQGELPTDPNAPVVAALDEAGTAQGALAYAFAASARSGRPLVVLRCVSAEQAKRGNQTGQALTLSAYRALYPDVDLTEAIAVGDPKDVLVQRSRNAALLVLGSRGHGRLTSTLFGSVGRDLIRRSGCPVVVARPTTSDLTEGAM